MRISFFFIAIAAAAATACSREEAGHADAMEPEKVNLTVEIAGGEGTKATGIKESSEDEEKINTLQVFIFNGDIVDGYGIIANDKSLTLGCTAGPRDVYALVNVPDLKSITGKAELLAKVSELSSDVNDFEMIGSTSETISTDGQKINMGVDRFAARIKVGKVTNALSSPSLQSQTFVLKSMHLTNVASDIDYGMSGNHTVGKWYNMMCHQASNNCGIVTYDSIGQTITYGKSYSTGHCFYAYPNDEEFSISETWSPRSTMLVLKIQIGSTLYNYPIVLPELKNNRSYEIDEIKITRPGNIDDGAEGGMDEMKPVEGTDCQFEVKVNPWTVIAVTEGTVI